MNYRYYKYIFLALIILTLITSIFAVCLRNESWAGFFTGLTDGLLTTIISFVLITILLEGNRKKIEDRNQRKKEEEISKNNTRNIELIRSVFNNQYNNLYTFLQTFFINGPNGSPELITPDFPFVRLKMIFDQNMIIRYGILKTNLEVFYHIFNKYIEGLRIIALTTDFGNQYQLKKLIIDYLNFIDSYDVESNMLELNYLIKNDERFFFLKEKYYEFVEDDNNISNPDPKSMLVITGTIHTLISNTILFKNEIDNLVSSN